MILYLGARRALAGAMEEEAADVDSLSISQLLDTEWYYFATIVMYANIPLHFATRVTGEGGAPEERIRRVGLRWVQSTDYPGAPWVVRLVVDNCGLENECPVSNIHLPTGDEVATDIARVSGVMNVLMHYSRDRPVIGEIKGDALLMHFTAFQDADVPVRITLDVRRRKGDRRPWLEILETTPSATGYAPLRYAEVLNGVMSGALGAARAGRRGP